MQVWYDFESHAPLLELAGFFAGWVAAMITGIFLRSLL